MKPTIETLTVEPPTTPSPSPADPALTAGVRLDGVEHGFGSLRVLERIDLEIAPGEVFGIVGASGCGKTTALELICGLIDPAGGAIEVDGRRSADDRLAACAYMPQSDLLLPWLSAIDNAGLALRNRGLSRSRARAIAGPLLERFGLGEFVDSRPHELSGGMRQRIAFCRTQLAAKRVLLLDEPFAALDAITRGQMQEWLADALRQDPRTTILVTHDVEEALFLCDRVAILSPRPGRVVRTLNAPDCGPERSRAMAISTDEFTSLRRQALESLQGGLG